MKTQDSRQEAPDIVDNISDDQFAINADTRKPRRGRRPIDDSDALAEIRQLVGEGAGLNNAASATAVKFAEADPKHRTLSESASCGLAP